MTKLIIDLITSKNPLLEDSDPCWDNYKQIGLKKKDGKTVPNCVPQEKTNMKAIKVSEKLSVSDGMGAWLKAFQDSDAPQFADADEDERRKMAIAAFLAAKRESKKRVEKEEVEIKEDELSQKKKEEVVTVRHKDSGKELSIVKTAVADYQKRGYYPVKQN